MEDKKMGAIEKVKELENNKQTFVGFDMVCQFLRVCEAVGVVACGGAFANDMSGQWFYC